MPTPGNHQRGLQDVIVDELCQLEKFRNLTKRLIREPGFLAANILVWCRRRTRRFCECYTLPGGGLPVYNMREEWRLDPPSFFYGCFCLQRDPPQFQQAWENRQCALERPVCEAVRVRPKVQ